MSVSTLNGSIAAPSDVAPLFASEDEKGVVASLLYYEACIPAVTKLVGPHDFGDLTLRAVFEVVTKHHREPGDFDMVEVARRVREHPAVQEPNLVFAELAEAVTTAAHAESFAKAVADASLRWRIMDVAATAASAASNGQAGEEVLADMGSAVEDLLRSRERTGGVPRFTLEKLRSEYPTLAPPVVGGLVREGETCNIIAASKVGKSWLAYGLALSIVNNEPWLGRFDVTPGKVLLIDNELHPETLAYRIPKVADAMGIPLDAVDRDFEVWPLRGNLRSLPELAAEFDKIEPGEFKAIILDAKYRFAAEGVSENDNAAETQVYNLLDRYAAKTRAAFILIHHSSKGDQSGKAVTDVGAGAGAQSRATDCHLVIRPHEEDDCAVLDAAVRSFAPIQPVTLRWALGGHVDRCDGCGHARPSYNSCRNRHCPKCQASARAAWMDARAAELLPVPYFHLVFTLPSQLGPIALQNPKAVYGILFRAAWETVRELAKDPKHLGAKVGMLSVLHTWGSNLMHHPHLHGIVPGGGVSLDGRRWVAVKRSRKRKAAWEVNQPAWITPSPRATGPYNPHSKPPRRLTPTRCIRSAGNRHHRAKRASGTPDTTVSVITPVSDASASSLLAKVSSVVGHSLRMNPPSVYVPLERLSTQDCPQQVFGIERLG